MKRATADLASSRSSSEPSITRLWRLIAREQKVIAWGQLALFRRLRREDWGSLALLLNRQLQRPANSIDLDRMEAALGERFDFWRDQLA